MKTMGLMLMGLMILIGGCDNIAPELLPALPGDGAGAPAFVPDRPYVRAYLVSPKPKVTLGREEELASKVAAIDWYLREAQEFYVSELERHGYGRLTFPIAFDADGRVHVTHITLPEDVQFYAKLPHWERKSAVYEAYKAIEPAPGEMQFFFMDDIPWHAIEAGGVCGNADWIYMNCAAKDTVAHELGHAFGLAHDWRNGEYVMSYRETREPDGTWTPVAEPRTKLSRGAAGWVARHPAFRGPVPQGCFLPTDVRAIKWGYQQDAFEIRFNAWFFDCPDGDIRYSSRTPADDAVVRAGFEYGVLLNLTHDLQFIPHVDVIRYLDKDIFQGKFVPGIPGATKDPFVLTWIDPAQDYMEYHLQFKAELPAHGDEFVLELIQPHGQKTSRVFNKQETRNLE